MNQFETNGFYTVRGFYGKRYMDELRDEIDSIGSERDPTTRIVTHPLDVEKVFFSNCCSSLSVKIFNVCFCVWVSKETKLAIIRAKLDLPPP